MQGLISGVLLVTALVAGAAGAAFVAFRLYLASGAGRRGASHDA